ncbi:hypothetical protein ACFSSA_02515 [Luteolibacter algae]|uniref:HEAT repeat domain-containing protein n=1 Tax=Luteolibacter algae TaxID=454151 RepID=A0ABW5D409_9BACT
MSYQKQCFLSGLLLLAVSAIAHAGPFVQPAEENPPFRRDLLPIDTDSMTVLSAELTLLTRHLSLETASQRRAAAQALALALALDPANQTARDTLSAIGAEKSLPKPKGEEVTRAKARLWQIRAWLATPEAGKDGNILAGYLSDAAVALDAKNPTAKELGKKPEQGNWDDWVAPLSAFEESPVVEETVAKTPEKKSKPEDKENTADKESATISLEEAEITSVMYQLDTVSKEWSLGPAIVRMKAEAAPPDGENGALDIAIPSPPEDEENIRTFITAPIKKALEKSRVALPNGGTVTLLAGENGSYSFAQNHLNLSGPGLILASSAITGIEPKATVIAQLDEEGELLLPHYFWNFVLSMEHGNGGRLIVPAAAEEFFINLLALEVPEFFLKYEVLLASTPEEMIALSAKAPDENHRAVFAQFSEIQAKSVGSPTGTYLTNRFVRQRLQEITDTAPYHLSAKLLAIQGAGERPGSLSREVLAAEIWRIISPVHAYSTFNPISVNEEEIEKIEQTYEDAKAAIDRLDRYTDIHDRDLLTEGKNLVASVRTFTRALGSRGDVAERYQAIGASHSDLILADAELRSTLSELTGDPLPEELKTDPRVKNRKGRRR